MSSFPPEQSTSPRSYDTDERLFQAIVVTDERATVLADLTQQAVDHFGHDRLRVSHVSVTGVGDDAVLASAEFTDLTV